jgi:hypothetical protein
MKIKQSQIYPGVTKCRAQAVKVHCNVAISEGDILCIVGYNSGCISVGIADSNGTLSFDGPMWVADYDAAAGDITPVAVPWKVFTTSINNSGGAINNAVFLSETGTTGNTHKISAGTGNTRAVGRFLDLGTTATALLYPGAGVAAI